MVWPPKHWLAVIGLLIEFVGVVIAAKWIVPTPPLFVDDNYDHVGEEAKRRRMVIMAWIGVTLILIGLVLQMIDAWISIEATARPADDPAKIADWGLASTTTLP